MLRICGQNFCYDPIIARLCAKPSFQCRIIGVTPMFINKEEELTMLKYAVSMHDSEYYCKVSLYHQCLYGVVKHGFVHLIEYLLGLHDTYYFRRSDNHRNCLFFLVKAVNADMHRLGIDRTQFNLHKCDLMNYGLSHEIVKRTDMDLYRNVMKWHAKKISTLKSVFVRQGYGGQIFSYPMMCYPF